MGREKFHKYELVSAANSMLTMTMNDLPMNFWSIGLQLTLKIVFFMQDSVFQAKVTP